jgi:peptidoglycan hydrolase-like protein with peptidoglycan-binding domain
MGAVATLAMAACSDPLEDSPVSQSASGDTRVAAAGDELDLGSRGEEVAAVHAYLSRHGYFPDDGHSRTYPTWRSIVAAGPRQPDVFDENTALALRALQTTSGLEPTGRIDAATRALLQRPRCGVPDGLLERDPSQKITAKFAIWGPLPHTALTWKLSGIDDVTPTQARTAIRAALASYSRETPLTFSETTSSTPDLHFKFEYVDGSGGSSNILAVAHPRAGGPGNFDVISIDTSESWSVAPTTPAGAVDLESVLLHEIGHGLGVSHSSIPGAVMTPTYPGTQRNLQLDDRVAVSTLYDVWTRRPGGAADISVGANGAVWSVAIGWLDSSTISRWNGSGWTNARSVVGAYRIAVAPRGAPWVVTSSGDLWRLSGDDPVFGSWSLVTRVPRPGPGQLDGASDVAIGGDGSVWALGREPATAGYPLFKLVGGAWSRDLTGRVASRVAVGPGGEPWVVDNWTSVYRRSSADPTTGTWSQLGFGSDIAINVGNYAWMVGLARRAGGSNVQLWNEQPAIPPGDAIARWIEIAGTGASSIAVGPNGAPWVVTDTGAILSRGP